MPPFLLFAGKKVAQSFGFAAFKKAGKFYFLQSSQTKGRGVLLHLVTPVLSAAVCKSSRIRHSPNSGTVRRFPVLPTPCAKTREFGEAEFSDCLPVFALECFSANETGVLISEFSAS